MFGTPEEVIRKLQIYEEQGVDQYCLGLSFNLPFELQVKTLRLFIDEVMPHFAARERAQDSQASRVSRQRGTEPWTPPALQRRKRAGRSHASQRPRRRAELSASG